MSERFYLRSWLSGRDAAESDELAREMRNFAYAIGDRVTGEAVLVDPAHAPLELVADLEADGLRLVGVIATHYHADHIGGAFHGTVVQGIAELVRRHPVPIHVQAIEASYVETGTGVGIPPVVPHQPGDVVMVGEIAITLLHTPGHTHGSQCLLVENCLFTGDTLFLKGCGFTGFANCDGEELYRSLQERLADIDDEVMVYPGHKYALAPSATMGELRRSNEVLEPMGLNDWLDRFTP
jgi:glyoxylase-like metal-dependent hydrolase (beta-lactamase superfamily II)